MRVNKDGLRHAKCVIYLPVSLPDLHPALCTQIIFFMVYIGGIPCLPVLITKDTIRRSEDATRAKRCEICSPHLPSVDCLHPLYQRPQLSSHTFSYSYCPSSGNLLPLILKAFHQHLWGSAPSLTVLLFFLILVYLLHIPALHFHHSGVHVLKQPFVLTDL